MIAWFICDKLEWALTHIIVQTFDRDHDRIRLDRLLTIFCFPQPKLSNKAFRTWFEKMNETIASELKNALEGFSGAEIELTKYFQESFGNETRIDYGTGHETNFIAFCCCLDKIGFFTKADDRAVILGIFHRYLLLCRRLQVRSLHF